MRKVLVAAGLVLVATACNSKAAHNPNVTSEEAKAQALVQQCAAHANFLTHDGRLAFVHCVAPQGSSTQVQSCATAALAKDGVLTKSQRVTFYGDVAKCIVPSSSPSPVQTKKGH